MIGIQHRVNVPDVSSLVTVPRIGSCPGCTAHIGPRTTSLRTLGLLYQGSNRRGNRRGHCREASASRAWPCALERVGRTTGSATMH
eukprot:1901736-Pyramimonas_sp.AAC.1